jgi:hypothetical protein
VIRENPSIAQTRAALKRKEFCYVNCSKKKRLHVRLGNRNEGNFGRTEKLLLAAPSSLFLAHVMVKIGEPSKYNNQTTDELLLG